MAVDSARAVDFVDRELNALKVLQAVTLFPGTGGADDVRRFGSGACGERQQRERRNGFKRQLPPPLWLGTFVSPELTRPKLGWSLIWTDCLAHLAPNLPFEG